VKGKPISITGQRFTRLVALKHIGLGKWKCQCDCGNTHIVKASHLLTGSVKSCGCLRKEKWHGMNNTRIYHIWENMKQRTMNPSANEYEHYGGRGIKVCDEWIDFKGFYSWVKTTNYNDEEKLTLDRIDNDGDYCPNNCRWVTRKKQNRNSSMNVNITYKGNTRCLTEWGEIYNIHPKTLSSRIKNGWSIENAFTIPVASKSNRGIGNHVTTNRIVNQYDLLGNFIKKWNSIKEASIATNTSLSGIGRCCSYQIKTSGGFVWRYDENRK